MGEPTYQLPIQPCTNTAIHNDLPAADLLKLLGTSTTSSPNDDLVVIHHGGWS